MDAKVDRSKCSPVRQLQQSARTTCSTPSTFNYQIVGATAILATTWVSYSLLPQSREHISALFQLPGLNTVTGQYVQHYYDIYFLAGAVVLITAIRALAVIFVTVPVRNQRQVDQRQVSRLVEQLWLGAYYAISWLSGMYIWFSFPTGRGFDSVLKLWPEYEMTESLKRYLLTQLAFWTQQLLVLHIEVVPRREYLGLLTHHVLACILIGTAYIYHLYRVTNVVLCLMYIGDLLLAVTKISKSLCSPKSLYISYCTLLVVWVLTRHILFLQFCWAFHKALISRVGCYYLANKESPKFSGDVVGWSDLVCWIWDRSKPICISHGVGSLFLFFLLADHFLFTMWLRKIFQRCLNLRITTKFVGSKVSETRAVK